jgi:hypothetical protein
MSERVKAVINSLFVQLNRAERQQSDFRADNFMRDLDAFFSGIDSADMRTQGVEIDEQLKLRINTVPRNAQPLTLVTANVLALYFWYVRRPPQQCQNAFLAAKKLRGITDDSQFVEQAIAPLIFGGKIPGMKKRDREFRELMLHRTAQIAVNFRESDEVPQSATRIIRSDSWQKKMLHIEALRQRGAVEEIRNFAPKDHLEAISHTNDFAAWYLRKHGIFKGENRFLRWLRNLFANFFSLTFSFLNWRFVVHLFRNKWPVYLVYLFLSILFVAAAYFAYVPWEYVHEMKVKELQEANPIGTQQGSVQFETPQGNGG